MVLALAPLHAAVPKAALPPSEIRGIKWTPFQEAKTGVLTFDTAGLPMADFLDQLHERGVNAVVLKMVDLENQIPDSVGPPPVKLAKRTAGLLEALQSLRAHPQPWHVFVWKRNWFEKNGRPNDGGDEFIQEMSELIQAAKQAGCDDILEGVMPIEINVESTPRMLKFALEAAHGINARTDGWLRGKTLLFPGAGMGGYFHGLTSAWDDVELSGLTKEPTFYETMAKEVRGFSFVLKNMPSQPAKSCGLDHYNEPFTENGTAWTGWNALGGEKNGGLAEGAEGADPAAIRYQFLNGPIGFQELRQFLREHQTAYPALANVIYWGDANEGMTANQRSQFFHQTWHQLLVTENGWGGHFTYYPALNKAGDTHSQFDLRKFLFQVKTVDGKNQLVARGTGWKNWQGWPHADYTITVTDSTN